MSVVCLGRDGAAAVGPKSPSPAASAYGLCGAKRKEEERRSSSSTCHGLFVLEKVVEEEEERSNSIGVESEEEEEEEEGEEVESMERRRRKKGGLGCLDALEDALPIKRGLSNFFSGKSKSFANLLDVTGTSAKDLAKPENPFNKRRRILLSSSLIKRASFNSLRASPPFPSPEHSAEKDDNDDGND